MLEQKSKECLTLSMQVKSHREVYFVYIRLTRVQLTGWHHMAQDYKNDKCWECVTNILCFSEAKHLETFLRFVLQRLFVVGRERHESSTVTMPCQSRHKQTRSTSSLCTFLS